MQNSQKLILCCIGFFALSAPLMAYALPSQVQFDQTMQQLKTASLTHQSQYVKQLTQWAKEGHVPSQVNLGQMYMQGDFVKKDFRQAFEWTSKAAQKDDAKAQNNLAKMYLRGLGVNKDTLKAYELFGYAAQKGLSDAYYNLGIMYEQGIGVEKRIPHAFSYYLKAVKVEAPQMLNSATIRAKQGSAIAQNDLGYMYAIGFATEKNSQQALYWFEQAAKQNLPEAFNNLGVLYDGSGEFVAKNFDPGYAKAIKHYKSSLTGAKKFEESATRVSINRDLANQYFNNALAMKLPAAYFNMAKKLETGLGQIADQQQAIQYYNQAITQGFDGAEYQLARLYLAKNDQLSKEKAISLFQIAARKGDTRAMNHATLLTGEVIDVPGWFNPQKPNAREEYQRWAATQNRDQLMDDDYSVVGIEKLIKQAKQGHASAQYKLALLKEEGVKNLPKDPVEAESLLKAAIAQGHALAEYELGWVYSREVVPLPIDQDDDSLFASYKYAMPYFEAAAEKRVPEALLQLAMIYDLGMGRDQDPAKSAFYYRQAAATGLPTAVDWISGFKQADLKKQ